MKSLFEQRFKALSGSSVPKPSKIGGLSRESKIPSRELGGSLRGTNRRHTDIDTKLTGLLDKSDNNISTPKNKTLTQKDALIIEEEVKSQIVIQNEAPIIEVEEPVEPVKIRTRNHLPQSTTPTPSTNFGFSSSVPGPS